MPRRLFAFVALLFWSYIGICPPFYAESVWISQLSPGFNSFDTDCWDACALRRCVARCLFAMRGKFLGRFSRPIVGLALSHGYAVIASLRIRAAVDDGL